VGFTGPLRSVAFVLALLACSAPEVEPVWETPEAIFLISLDTLRADYLTPYGYELHDTSPTLQRLASEGVVFDSCVVAEPRTLTSHMSLLTGLHPQHHRVDDPVPLPEGIATLAGLLRREGWATHGWADGAYLRDRWGFDRGFDTYDSPYRRGFREILPEVRNWLKTRPAPPIFAFLHTYDVHNVGIYPHYRAPRPARGRFTRKTTSLLRSNSRRAFNARYEAHRDALSGEDYAYLRGSYAEGVRYVDNQLRFFFEFLRRHDLYERSLIVVWSDHGEGLFDHGEEWAHGQVYDNTTRCALIMKIPGVTGNRRVKSVASSVDLLPTVLDLARLEVPPGLDGRSIVSEIFNDTGSGVGFSQRTKNGGRLFSIRTPRHHLFWNGDDDSVHFFDLADDPGELENLSPSGTEIEDRLRAQLDEWVREHDEARGRAVDNAEVPIDTETEAELRALGYIE
jgi:arylsulfatase A-like enzyme